MTMVPPDGEQIFEKSPLVMISSSGVARNNSDPNRAGSPMRKHLVVALLLVLARPCHAYQVAGVGAFSCVKVVTALRGSDQDAKNSIVIWFQGYISGRDAEMELRTGRAKPGTFPEPAVIRIFIENYCATNPMSPSGEAGDALWKSIRDQ